MPEPSPFVAFVSACARAGLQTAFVPLEVYIEFAGQVRTLPLAKLGVGYIGVAEDAIVIRPLALQASAGRDFTSPAEILEFLEQSKKAL